MGLLSAAKGTLTGTSPVTGKKEWDVKGNLGFWRDTFGGGKAPEREVIDLDQNTKDLISGQQARSARSADEIADEQLQGTQNYAQEAQGAVQDQNRYATSLAMTQPDDFDAALSKRASKAFDYSQAGLRSQAKLKAGDYKAGQMGQAAEYAHAESKIQYAQQAAAKEKAVAKKAQQAALYGAIYGAAGAVVGTYFGGPAGGQAGMQAGQAVGTQSYHANNKG